MIAGKVDEICFKLSSSNFACCQPFHSNQINFLIFAIFHNIFLMFSMKTLHWTFDGLVLAKRNFSLWVETRNRRNRRRSKLSATFNFGWLGKILQLLDTKIPISTSQLFLPDWTTAKHNTKSFFRGNRCVGVFSSSMLNDDDDDDDALPMCWLRDDWVVGVSEPEDERAGEESTRNSQKMGHVWCARLEKNEGSSFSGNRTMQLAFRSFEFGTEIEKRINKLWPWQWKTATPLNLLLLLTRVKTRRKVGKLSIRCQCALFWPIHKIIPIHNYLFTRRPNDFFCLFFQLTAQAWIVALRLALDLLASQIFFHKIPWTVC